MYMNKRQIIKAFNSGLLDDVVKQLRTYGTITKDKSFDIDEGYHAGSHRMFHVSHHGIDWEVSMHNGEVKGVGHNHV